MQSTTQINETDAIISTRNDSILGLTMTGNKKLFYLPIQIDEKFPSLMAYEAPRCSIKEIFKRNFKKLSNLISEIKLRR